MKKIIMSAMLLSSIALVNKVHAQSFGVKGGVNIANVTNFGNGSRVGANAGIFLHQQLNKNWCIQPEVVYSSQGSKFMAEEGQRTLALNYVQVPVMFQYFPVNDFYLEAGPQAGILTNARVKNLNNGNDHGVAENFKKGDFGVNVGAGIKATSRVGFYARYNFGLTNISKDESKNFKNSVGQVGAYVRLTK